MFNTIGYTGKVTIKVKNKPPVRRNNAGTSALFSHLCHTITGTTSVSETAPTAFGILKSGGAVSETSLQTDPNFSKYLSQSVLISNLPIVSRRPLNSSQVQFSAVLWNSNTNSTVSENIDKCFVVMLNNKNEILAYSKFNYSDIRPVWNDFNSQCVIEWLMEFANNTTGGAL